MAQQAEALVAINPKKFSVAELIKKVDDLSLDELIALQASEKKGRGRKTLLAAVGAAIEAHEALAEKLDDIVDEGSEAVVPVAMSVAVLNDRLGFYAAHPGAPGFETLRFGNAGACLSALSARLLG
tara:strand:- start:225 stop:602 length:378 start_codon:yes stop_codon:yes gene_type:complete